jgi:hypothetical protein
MAKFILPWFGGGPGVWTTCMLFFQVLLLGGYAYAHLTSRWLKPRAQAILHLALLAGALLLLPITPGASWKPDGTGNPQLQILGLLLANLGLSYFVLSATGPLVQQWFTRTEPGRSPYRLYALSNAGSLLALVSYPFVIEPLLAGQTQAAIWGWGLGGYALCCGFCAVKFARADGPVAKGPGQRGEVAGKRAESTNPAGKLKPGNPETGAGAASTTRRPAPRPETTEEDAPSIATRVLWLLLPACASVLLLAVTNSLCLDMAVVPFMWVLPLALYLLSFIICFDRPGWYRRAPFTLILIAGCGAICWAIYMSFTWPIGKLAVVQCIGLFACCLVCHGELYRLRPHPKRLTSYYLAIAAGGALGGVFVTVVAPLIFDGYFELHVGVLVCALLFLFACVRDHDRGEQPQWVRLSRAMPLVALAGVNWLLVWLAAEYPAHQTVFRVVQAGTVALAALAIGLGLSLRGSARQPPVIRKWLVLLLAPWAAGDKFAGFRHWHRLAGGWQALGVLALGTTLWLQRERHIETIIETSRNFYGVLRVFETNPQDPALRMRGLAHGRVSHGVQFVDPQRSSRPTHYYGEGSGVGVAIRSLPNTARRLGIVGLGIGTLTAYARAGDDVRIYEIDPDVRRIASRFTYLTHCPAALDIVLGDARLALEGEPPQNF